MTDKDMGVPTPAQAKQVAVVGRYLDPATAWAEVFSAEYVGLELAVACTTTELETGGRSVYGADPASSWMNDGPFGTLWEQPVTESNYKWFIGHVKAGAVSNGVGVKQLTSLSLLEAADARGGAWQVQHNCAEGDRFFVELLHQAGSLWAAFRDYNGSGPAADAYANRAVALVETWRARLA